MNNAWWVDLVTIGSNSRTCKLHFRHSLSIALLNLSVRTLYVISEQNPTLEVSSLLFRVNKMIKGFRYS